MRRRFDEDDAASANDIREEESMSRFNQAHRRIGKTVFAAVSLFLCGSVRATAVHFATSFARAMSMRRTTHHPALSYRVRPINQLMIFYGVQALPTEFDRGVSMCAVGSVMFIPGSYASWTLFGAWRGWSGYSFESLPSYDEGAL